MCWALALVGLTSCARPAEYADHHLRIVSLSPAITQVLVEIGLADAIVAVGEGDKIVPRGVPTLGRYRDLDLERLTTLAPSHVFAMTGRASLPRRVTELGASGRFRLADFEYPRDAVAVAKLTREIGEALGRAERTEKIAAEIEHRLRAIGELTARRDRPRVLMVFASDPVWASGSGTVIDELLHIAGGANAAAGAKLTALTYDREALRALAPDALVLMKPGDPPLTSSDDPRLDAFRGLDLPAMRKGQFFLLNDPGVLLPGPSVATTAASIAVALHPDLAEPIAEIFREQP
ncbi:MAG: ABC transporter substrate-binding protein [Planctomycetota bacterium]